MINKKEVSKMPGEKKVKKPYKTKLGRFFEDRGVTTTWISKESGVNRTTLNKMLNKTCDYAPNTRTIKKIMKVVNKLDPKKKSNHFFDI